MPWEIDLDGKMSRVRAPATPLRNVPRGGNGKTAVWSGGSQGAKDGTPAEVSTQVAKTKAMRVLEWSQTLFNEITLVSTKPLRAEASGGTQRVLGWILIGAAAAALAAGTYFGIQANNNYNCYTNAQYKVGGPSQNCAAGGGGAQYYEDQTAKYQTPANVSFAVAGGLGAIGIGFEIWGLALGSSTPEKHVEVVK